MREILSEISELQSGYAAKRKLRGKLARRLRESGAADGHARGLPDEGGLFSGLDQLVKRVRGCNDRILSIEPDGLKRFLSAVVGDEVSRRRLCGLFSGAGGGACIRHFARVENEAIEMLVRGRAGDGFEIFDAVRAFRETLSADIAMFREFIRDFRALYREGIGFDVIGYGEISTVFSLRPGRVLGSGLKPAGVSADEWIYKKLPPFQDRKQLERYVRIYREYREILTERVGLNVPPQRARVVEAGDGKFTVYAGQLKRAPETVGNVVVRDAPPDVCVRVFRAVLGEIGKLAEHNRANPGGQVGLDGQVSNWSVVFDSSGEVGEIVYLDTSTPLYRVGGEEQLDPEIILQTTPGPLRWFIRKFMLKGVVDRYYEARLVVADLVANFIKEGRPELVPELARVANSFFGGELSRHEIAPLSAEGIFKYYRSDAMIWKFFQFSRRVDKFVVEKVLRREYGYRLPGRIDR